LAKIIAEWVDSLYISGPFPRVFAENLSRPSGICAHGNTIWVANPGNGSVTILSNTGAVLGIVQSLLKPRDLCFWNDEVFVTNDNRVSVFRCVGSFDAIAIMNFVRSFPSVLASETLFMPTGICASGGCVYVADMPKYRVSVFRVDGTFVRHIWGNLIFPRGVAIWNNFLIVSDHYQISVFQVSDGKFVRHFGGDNLEKPCRIAVAESSDCNVELHVADSRNRICVFRLSTDSSMGVFVRFYGSESIKDPVGIVNCGGLSFVTNYDTGSVTVLETD
jgi:DNA-binding beta-propeller fold protein YncE